MAADKVFRGEEGGNGGYLYYRGERVEVAELKIKRVVVTLVVRLSDV